MVPDNLPYAIKLPVKVNPPMTTVRNIGTNIPILC